MTTKLINSQNQQTKDHGGGGGCIMMFSCFNQYVKVFEDNLYYSLTYTVS